MKPLKGNLLPALGKWSCVSLVVGGIIGSGIFMKPSAMAAQLGSPELVVLVWIFAGLITLAGALSSAEVATMLPQTGGPVVYFKYMYGDFVAFLYGWAGFAVFNTAGVASIAYVFGSYFQYFIELPRFSPEIESSVSIPLPWIGKIFPLQNIGVKSVTIFIVVVLTWFNYRSTRAGANIQVVFTALKVIAILFVVVGLFSSDKGSWSNLTRDSNVIHHNFITLIGAIAAAMSGAFWGYDGWNNITFVAGELKDPQRLIARSLLVGLIICIGIYVLTTMAFLYVLPVDVAANSPLIASDAATTVMGSVGGGIIAALVMISTFGTTNGNIMATARVTYAMAREGYFFKWCGDAHEQYHTPGKALVLHAAYTSLLVLSGSFDMLTDMLIFVSYVFYALGVFGIFILRRKMKDVPRPYRVWGYPYVPFVFLIFATFFLFSTVINDIILFANGETTIINSLFGVMLTLTGVPLYFYFKRRPQKSTDQ